MIDVPTVAGWFLILSNKKKIPFYYLMLMFLFFWWWWLLWFHMICLYVSTSILFYFRFKSSQVKSSQVKSSQVKCVGSSFHHDDYTTSYSPPTWPSLSISSNLRPTTRLWPISYRIYIVLLLAPISFSPVQSSRVHCDASYDDLISFSPVLCIKPTLLIHHQQS